MIALRASSIHESLPFMKKLGTDCANKTLYHPALPALLAHSGLIQVPAMVMSIIGGLLIYGTIISFTMFFQEEQDF